MRWYMGLICPLREKKRAKPLQMRACVRDPLSSPSLFHNLQDAFLLLNADHYCYFPWHSSASAASALPSGHWQLLWLCHLRTRPGRTMQNCFPCSHCFGGGGGGDGFGRHRKRPRADAPQCGCRLGQSLLLLNSCHPPPENLGWEKSAGRFCQAPRLDGRLVLNRKGETDRQRTGGVSSTHPLTRYSHCYYSVPPLAAGPCSMSYPSASGRNSTAVPGRHRNSPPLRSHKGWGSYHPPPQPCKRSGAWGRCFVWWSCRTRTERGRCCPTGLLEERDGFSLYRSASSKHDTNLACSFCSSDLPHMCTAAARRGRGSLRPFSSAHWATPCLKTAERGRRHAAPWRRRLYSPSTFFLFWCGCPSSFVAYACPVDASKASRVIHIYIYTWPLTL